MNPLSLPISDEAVAMRRLVRLTAPRTARQLHAYIRAVLGFNLPRVPMITGHDAPFAYVEHAFFEDRTEPGRDCIVWANRGGGKTQIGAIATLLDLLFKPGIQVRILGGSFDQSSKMYRYLKQMLQNEVFCDLIAGSLTGRFVELTNGSRVEVLSQSERAVRGQRVHKLRCDEVELFEPEVWEAAQLVTRSGRCGGVQVRAAIEVLSTMHRPFGLMQRLLDQAGVQRRRVFRWNVLDTLRHCEANRLCEGCLLWEECRGRAKLPAARGFIHIDDAIQQKQRVGPHTWEAEMLCERPTRSDCVYPEFDLKLHVFGEENPNLQTSKRPHESGSTDDVDLSICRLVDLSPRWIGGIDFGYRALTVLLWACVDDDGVIHVVDELALRECVTERFIALAAQHATDRGLPQLEWVGADPAGHQRSEHTGISTIAMWKRAGWTMRTRVLPLEAGIDAVHRRLRRADGTLGLRIHRRCGTLIESLAKYRYAHDRPDCAAPLKDGADHAPDALRYLIVNLDRQVSPITVRDY